MMIEFYESGMHFLFDEKKIYHIEKSELYEKLKGKGVACVECIVLHKNYICFVEAKSSVPTTEFSDKERFWKQIRKKDIDSFLMFSKQVLGEKTLDIGEELKKSYFNKPLIRFVLIINGSVRRRIVPTIDDGLKQLKYLKIRRTIIVATA